MRETLRELGSLAKESLVLWFHAYPTLASLFLICWIPGTLMLHLALAIGGQHPILSSLAFVASQGCSVMAYIVMIRAMKPHVGLRSQAHAELFPRSALSRESWLEVALLSVGPFLAVWAAWGFTERSISDFFQLHFMLQPVLFGGNQDRQAAWGISMAPSQLWRFVIFALVALALREVIQLIERRRRCTWLGIPLLFAEVLWAFSAFFVAAISLTWLKRDIRRYDVYRNLLRLRDDLSALIPDIPWPQFLKDAGAWLADNLLPGFWDHVLLPLVFLAIVATVLGWRGVRASQAWTGRTSSIALRVEQHYDRRKSELPPLVKLWDIITGDFVDKYVPVFRSLGFSLRAGLPFLGAYILLSAVVDFGAQHLMGMIVMTVGPLDRLGEIIELIALSLVDGLIVVTVQVALWVTAFRHVVDGFVRTSMEQSAPSS